MFKSSLILKDVNEFPFDDRDIGVIAKQIKKTCQIFLINHQNPAEVCGFTVEKNGQIQDLGTRIFLKCPNSGRYYMRSAFEAQKAFKFFLAELLSNCPDFSLSTSTTTLRRIPISEILAHNFPLPFIDNINGQPIDCDDIDALAKATDKRPPYFVFLKDSEGEVVERVVLYYVKESSDTLLGDFVFYQDESDQYYITRTCSTHEGDPEELRPILLTHWLNINKICQNFSLTKEEKKQCLCFLPQPKLVSIWNPKLAAGLHTFDQLLTLKEKYNWTYPILRRNPEDDPLSRLKGNSPRYFFRDFIGSVNKVTLVVDAGGLLRFNFTIQSIQGEEVILKSAFIDQITLISLDRLNRILRKKFLPEI